MVLKEAARLFGTAAGYIRTPVSIGLAESPLSQHAPEDVRTRLRQDAAARYCRAVEEPRLPGEEDVAARQVKSALSDLLRLS